MEETLQKSSNSKREPAERSVTVSIGSGTSVLNGLWQWDMQSDALYSSDVMAFPADFEGTKSIIHPDDLPNVRSAVGLLSDGSIDALDFRIITTYGEIKRISGKNISLDNPTDEAAAGAPWDEALEAFALRKEAEYLKQRKELADNTEKLCGIGSWAMNKTTGEAWYSDGMYRLHGLPPQSLNAHAATFNSFIHPDDRLTVLDAVEKAYAAEVPLHLEYAIVPADGTVRRVRQVAQWSFNDRGQSLFSGTVRDLSEEHALMESAQASDNVLRQYQQMLRFGEHQWHTGYWMLNLVTRKITYSENYYRIYGLKQTHLPNNNAFLNLVHPDDRLRIQTLADDMYRQHVLPEAEFRIIRPDGRQRHLKQSGKLITGPADLVMVGIVQDVTVQRGLEKKIAELNEKTDLEEVVKGLTEGLTGMGVAVWYPEDGSVLWSEGFYRLLGYRPDAVEASSRLLHKQIHSEDLKSFKDAETLAVNGQAPPDHYFRVVNKGGIRQLRINFNRATAGHRDAVIGIVTEITGENLLHQKLFETAAYAEKLADAVADIVVVTDTDNNVVQWNAAAAQKTGIKKDEALYANFFDLFPALRDDRFLSQLRTAREGGEVKEPKAKARYIPKPHRYSLVPIQDETGGVKRVLHLVQDISKELELQQQLAERLNFIERLVEASVDRIVVLNRHMNYLYWNKKAEEYYAIKKEKIIGKNILEIFPSFRADPSYAEFRRVLRGETVYLPPATTGSSKEYFETYLIPVTDESGEAAAVLWIVHDLNNELKLQKEREKAQDQLAEEHRRLKEAQAVGQLGSFEWTVGEEASHWSDELFHIHGLKPGEIETTPAAVHIYIHPDDRAAVKNLITASVQTPGSYAEQHRIIRNDGEVRWVNHQWESIAGADGTVAKVSGIVQDITERKKAEAEAEHKQELLQATMDSSMDMVQVFKAVRNEEGEMVDFTYVLLNHEAEKWMPAVLGKSLLRQQPGVVQEGIFDAFKQVVESGIPQQYEKYYTHEQFNGWFYQSVVKLDDGVATTTANITKRKEAEREILRLKDGAAQKATDKYYSLFNSIDEGFCIIELLYDAEGKAVDYRIVETNAEFQQQTGLKDAVNKTSSGITLNAAESYWLEAYDKVARTGESRRLENYHEPTGRWYTAYVSRIGGGQSREVAIVLDDISERKLREAQQEYLLKLSDALRLLADPVAIQQTAMQMIGGHLVAHRAFYGDMLDDEDTLLIGPGYADTVFPLEGYVRFSEFDSDMVTHYRKGQTVVINDIATDVINSEYTKAAMEAVQVRAAVGVPLVKAGKVCGILSIHQSHPRKWTAAEVALIEETAERTWAAVERARAEEALRKSEEKFRTLFTSIDEGYCLIEVIVDKEGKPVDELFLEMNPAYEQHTGLTKDIVGKRTSEIIPGREPEWLNFFGNVALTGKPARMEYHVDALGRWFETHASRVGGEGSRKVAVVFNDITKRKLAEKTLNDFNQVLEQQVEERTAEIEKNLSVLKQTEDIAAIGSWEYQIPFGRFTWSDGMYRIFDYPMGAPVQPEAYIHSAVKEDKPVARRIAKYIKTGRQDFEETVRIKRSDGAVRQLKVKGAVVKDEEGRPQKVVGVDLDITDIKAAEEKIREQDQYAQTIIDASIDQMTVFDRDYRFIAWNRRSEEVGGLKKEDVIGKSIFDVFPSVRDDPEFMAAQEKAMAGELVYIPAKRGIYTKGYQEWFYVPLKTEKGETYAVLNIIHDIAARIKAEEQLQQKARELEAKNEEITNFAFIASHDLKEPIRKIHTFSNWLMEREADGLSIKGKEYAFKIAASVRRLDALIEDITTLTKLQAIKTAPSDVDLAAVLAEAEAELGEMIEGSGAVVESKGLPVITGDRKQLVHLFRNLISNGIKFQQLDVVPVIEITCAKKTDVKDLPPGDWYGLKFTDNGIGFDMEYAEKIFQVFQRLHGPAQYPGTGIGLAICKKIMDNHGGGIKAESKPGRGSVFCCYFPVPGE